MKHINTYINEKLRLTTKRTYTCQPENKYELRKIIIQRIKDDGTDCDLNDIDVSKITDMANLFDIRNYGIFYTFNGDVSMWNVSNVKTMGAMFYGCIQFDCNLSSWDVSNVEYMSCMFEGCEIFNCDLSKWNISKLKYINYMFYGCEKFNHDLNKWDVSKVTDMENAFTNCPTKPTWYDKDKWETQ